MIRLAVDDLLEQVLGLREVASVLVEDTKVHEGLEPSGTGLTGLLVELDRLVLLTEEIEHVRKSVQMLGLVAVPHGFAVRLDRARAVAGQFLLAALSKTGVGAPLVDGAASDDGVETLGHSS